MNIFFGLVFIAYAGNVIGRSAMLGGLTYDEILRNLMFSYSAYCPSNGEHGISDWLCLWCQKTGVELENIRVFLDEKSQLLVYGGTFKETGSEDTHLVIGFRGTPDPLVSIITFIYDVDFRHVDNPFGGKGRIMKGWEECYQFIGNDSVALVRDLFESVPEISKMTVTGHSLGGCIADLALVQFVQEIESVRSLKESGNLKLMHFGSPRIGDDEFMTFFLSDILDEKHIFRVTYENDIAPHFPPQELEYHHIPTEIWFKTNKTSGFVTCDGSGEDKNCADSFTSVLDLSYRKHFEYLGIKLTKGVRPPYWCVDSG